jgi:hypothetical protein
LEDTLVAYPNHKREEARPERLEEVAYQEELQAQRYKQLWFNEEEGFELEYDENGEIKF